MNVIYNYVKFKIRDRDIVSKINKMSKIYVSQLFKDTDIGIEIIEFGIGFVLDKNDNGLNDYYKRMGSCIDNRFLSLQGPFLI